LYEILKEFNTRGEAIAYEIELHARYDVANNPDFYNKVRQTASRFSRKGLKSNNAKAVYQLDIQTGKILNEFESTVHASKYLEDEDNGVKIKALQIAVAARGKQKTAGGFAWKYVNEYTPEFFKYLQQTDLENWRVGKNNSAAKAVYQLDKKTGIIIKKWDYVNEAAQNLKINPTNIATAARGEIPSAGGYKWRYV
jgi:hypothetical protein